MEERDKYVSRKMHVKLVRELDTTGLLLDHLYQDDVLTEEDVEKIKAKKTSKKRAEKLLKILRKRRGGLQMLIKALILTKVQDYLGREILEKATWNEEEKKAFDQRLNGSLDEHQKLKADLAAMNRKIQQLESTCAEYKRTIMEMNEKLQRKESSPEASSSNVIRKLLTRLKSSSKEKANSTDDLHPMPQNGSRTTPSPEVTGDVPNDSADISRGSSVCTQSRNSASLPIEFPSLPLERSSIRRHSVPLVTRDRRRSGSRTGSVVSSASLRIRNAIASVWRSPDTDGYSTISHRDSL